MKHFVLAAAMALFAASAHASKTVLPDSCGADDVKFDVDSQKDAAAPAGPAEGKAQIVFIETLNRPGTASAILGGPHFPDLVTRFGLDGAWVGAAKANTYFAVDATPGEHHLCSSVKGSKDLIGIQTLTVEAGKTYFVEYKIMPNIVRGHVTSMGGTGGGGNVYGSSPTAEFTVLNEETGRFRVKSSTLSLSRAK